MKQVSLRLDDELHAAIERARGDVPRERWIRGALIAAATGEPGSPARGAKVKPVASRFERVHHPRCACPMCKPPKGKA